MPHYLYKEIGETPLDLIKKLKTDSNRKYSFAGRLDPMARGQMIILEGEECKQTHLYCNLTKIYEFEVLFGFQTDTYDILGLVENFTLTKNNISIINTKFGAILSTDPLFLNNLIYIAAYEDNTIEVSSNTLIFNWKIEDNIKFYNNIREDKDFKKNSAGIYYFKLYPTFEYFKTNILEIISIAFKKTNNYVNK